LFEKAKEMFQLQHITHSDLW